MGKTALTLAYLVLLSSCTALTNFGEFVFEDLGQNQDMLVRDLTPGPDLNCGIPAVCDTDGKSLLACGVKTECRCIAGSLTLGYPAHCAPAPSNGINLDECNSATAGKDITLTKDATYEMDAKGTYMRNKDNSDEQIIPFGGQAVALLCVNNLLASNVTIVGHGDRPFVIVADSTIDYSGNISVAGTFGNLPGAAAVQAPGGPGGGTGGGAGGGGQLQIAPMHGGKGGGPVAGGGGGGGNAAAGGAGGKNIAGNATAAGGGPHALALLGGGGGGGAAVQNVQNAQVSGTPGFGGGGGGVLQITAALSAKLTVQINATGGAGGGGGSGSTSGTIYPGGGGGGGGAGGTLFIEAPNVQLNGSRSCISVYGGAGGSGGVAGSPGAPGSPVLAVSACPYKTVPTGTAGMGGDPEPGKMNAGTNSSGSRGAGGGAGAPGRVTVRSQNEYKADATDLPISPKSSFTWQAY